MQPSHLAEAVDGVVPELQAVVGATAGETLVSVPEPGRVAGAAKALESGKEEAAIAAQAVQVSGLVSMPDERLATEAGERLLGAEAVAPECATTPGTGS